MRIVLQSGCNTQQKTTSKYPSASVSFAGLDAHSGEVISVSANSKSMQGGNLVLRVNEGVVTLFKLENSWREIYELPNDGDFVLDIAAMIENVSSGQGRRGIGNTSWNANLSNSEPEISLVWCERGFLQ